MQVIFAVLILNCYLLANNHRQASAEYICHNLILLGMAIEMI